MRRPPRPRQIAAAGLALALAGCVPRVAPPPAAAPRPAARPPGLRDAMLAVHAAARARVGLAPLAWDDGLAAEAAGWARTLARTRRFEHADREAEGENLWRGTRGAFAFAEMAGYWVAERPPAGRRARFEDAGHYAQIVWHDTRRVGCGLASNARDDVLVCRYWPAGNVIGEGPG